MIKRGLRNWFFILFAITTASSSYADAIDELIDRAIAGNHRDPRFVGRDQYRHPKETLEFFGLEPDMTVVEIWPSMGWYTEILAPVLREKGIFYAAGFAMTADKTPDWRKEMHKEFMEKLEKRPDVYDHVVITELSVPERTTIAPPGTVDLILTFRNVHNWMKGGYTEMMLKVFYRTLKPGGILGIVEHRAAPETSIEQMINSGYVTQEFVIALTEAIGFKLEEASEINANPNDARNYPEGVWTLPPTLRNCEKLETGSEKHRCIAKYTAIGESDRMTLRFRKPSE
jgi:predicted methyltransferase